LDNNFKLSSEKYLTSPSVQANGGYYASQIGCFQSVPQGVSPKIVWHYMQKVNGKFVLIWIIIISRLVFFCQVKNTQLQQTFEQMGGYLASQIGCIQSAPQGVSQKVLWHCMQRVNDKFVLFWFLDNDYK